MLNGKSIGWLPTKAHFADAKEATKKSNWHEGMLIVDEGLLIEYAVGTIPVNTDTVVEVVSNIPGAEPVTLAELEKSMQKRIENIDIGTIAQEAIARMRGRV